MSQKEVLMTCGIILANWTYALTHATSTIATCKLQADYYTNMLCTILKGPASDVVKDEGSIA